MKAVIQRVSHASVVVDGETTGACGQGYLILLGVAEGDTEVDAELLCRKIVNLRIFTDEVFNGVCNGTLFGRVNKGVENRHKRTADCFGNRSGAGKGRINVI